MDGEPAPQFEALPESRRFGDLVNIRLAETDAIDFKDAPFHYLPQAARFNYAPVPIEENYAVVPDDDGFLRMVADQVREPLTPEQVKNIIGSLNTAFKEKNLHFVYAKDKDRQFAIPVGPGMMLNTLDSDERGRYQHFGKKYADIDDPANPKKVGYIYTVPEKNCSRLIIVNEDLIDINPQQALVTLAHEFGHELESRKIAGRQAGDETIEAAPDTEVCSTILGYKMAEALYEKTGDPEYANGAVLNLRLYNQVIFGDQKGGAGRQISTETAGMNFTPLVISR